MQRFSVSTDDVALVEVFLHRRVVDRQRGVEQQLAVFLRLLRQIGRDRLVVVLGAELAALPDDRLHLDQVDDAEELVLDADRQLQRQRDDVQLLLQRGERAEEIGAGAVQLVDEDDARHVVAVGEAPVGLRLRLHAGHALDDEDRAVQHAQAAVHLDVEVDVARRVDDVDAVVVPLAGHRGGGDGDAALALLLHVIGRGVAVVHLADLVRHAGVIEDPLGRGRLARVDMRGDADVADLVERRDRHGEPPYHDGRPGTSAPRARMLTRPQRSRLSRISKCCTAASIARIIGSEAGQGTHAPTRLTRPPAARHLPADVGSGADEHGGGGSRRTAAVGPADGDGEARRHPRRWREPRLPDRTGSPGAPSADRLGEGDRRRRCRWTLRRTCGCASRGPIRVPPPWSPAATWTPSRTAAGSTASTA